MLTRCPSCATAFRVSAEQLKVRQGRVRCGQCREVFNALTTLVDELPPVQAAMEAPLLEETPLAVAESAAVPAPAVEESTAAQEPPAVAEPVAEPPAPVEPASSSREELPPPAVYLAADEAAQPTWPDYTEDTYAAPVYSRAGRGAAWLWGACAFLALLVLLLQGLLHYRTELSLSFPEAASLLRESSAIFGLDLPLPQKAELLAIETSDLHPGAGAQLVLTATLKNRAAFPQAYPHLELTLTDVGDQALVRKVLAPLQYLPAGLPATAGFAANGELSLSLTLEASVANAAGYRIYVFYP